TTFKPQQYTKRSELEGYHCTTNPYYSDVEKTSAKLKDEIDLKESLIAKLSQELQQIKVQMVQQQQELENSKKLAEQIENNKRIRQEVESARNEAVIYQAQLGSATNIRWSDDTLNYPIQLTKEIEKLCRKIDDFAKVKGKCYAINEKSALCLLEKYESKTCTVDKGFKLLLSFALQRMRDGQDIIAAMTPIKIRQQILRLALSDELIYRMDQYRIIEDDNIKKAEVDHLIRFGIQLWFNLKVQEPSPKIKWYNAGDQIKMGEQVFCKGHVVVRPRQNKFTKILQQIF
ncbi:20059_t:CDS:2, partial [Gigaspora rosea]